MTYATTRRGLVAVALLPALTAALLIRPAGPADGQEAAFGLYALTVSGAATTTLGEAGAGGGLAVIDAGAPSVTGRLDSSPSGAVKAAPVEPGTLFRTVVNLANNEAGGETVPVPTAEAGYPGSNGEDTVEGSGVQEAGPYTTTGYHARATASELGIAGEAEATQQRFDDGSAGTTGSSVALRQGLTALAAAYPSAGFEVSDDPSTYRTEGGRVTASASADPAAGTLEATVTSVSGRTTILGQISYGNVVGTATVSLADGERVASAATDVGAISVAGVPVTLGSDGLVVADTELLPGQSIAELNGQLNAVLGEAGVTLEPLEPTEEAGSGFAEAASGGVRVTIATAPNPQVPGNTLTVVLGQATASLSDEPPFATTDLGAGGFGSGLGTGASGPSGATDGGSFDTGTAPTAGAVGVPSPQVAPPLAAGAEEPVYVAGRRISKRVALAAFGGWQLLSLSICTLAAFALRPRETEPAW